MAWKESEGYFPLVRRRILNRDFSVPLTFVAYDVLRKGRDVTAKPYRERRKLLESLELEGPEWTSSEPFDDGTALYAAVCQLGFEGVVAKRLDGRYRPGERGWVKIKNPNYWRRESEIESMQRARTRVRQKRDVA